MKELNDLYTPDDCRYSDDHEWARQEDGIIRVGITDFAQDQLGDIVFVELPEVGTVVVQNDEFGTVESVKAVSELLIPVSGEVVAVNPDLADTPELVNTEPYEGGWMIEVKPADENEFEALMDVDTYRTFLEGAH